MLILKLASLFTGYTRKDTNNPQIIRFHLYPYPNYHILPNYQLKPYLLGYLEILYVLIIP